MTEKKKSELVEKDSYSALNLCLQVFFVVLFLCVNCYIAVELGAGFFMY